MNTSLIVAICAISIIFIKLWFNKKEREKERVAEIAFEAEKVQRSLDKVATLKTPTAQIRHCETALAQLYKLEEYPNVRSVVSNLDELKVRLHALIKVLPIMKHIEKAYRHQFKGAEKAEKNALLDALYDIETNDVTNEDFFNAETFPEGTGEIVEIESIKRRLTQLGWSASK